MQCSKCGGRMVPEENVLHDPELDNILRCEVCGSRIYDFVLYTTPPKEKGDDAMSKHVTDKLKVCEDPGCSNEFKPSGNRQIYCGAPDCPRKKKAKTKKVRRRPGSKGGNGVRGPIHTNEKDTKIVWTTRAQKIKDLVDEITELETGIVEKRGEIVALLNESEGG